MNQAHRLEMTEDFYCPTAEEIRAACRAIQATWSEAERRRRRGWSWDEELPLGALARASRSVPALASSATAEC